MFTGIVEDIGEIVDLKATEFDRDFVIKNSNLSKNLNIGDSIAVNGVCLTVREKLEFSFLVSASDMTLKLTNLGKLLKGDLVNLETSLTLQKPLGGHLMQGHVADSTIIIDKTHKGDAIYFRFKKPTHLNNYIVDKGYIAIDGMSLTICAEGDDWFEIMMIMHTQQVTIGKNYQIGTKVNLEVDIFARYIEKLHGAKN